MLAANVLGIIALSPVVYKAYRKRVYKKKYSEGNSKGISESK